MPVIEIDLLGEGFAEAVGIDLAVQLEKGDLPVFVAQAGHVRIFRPQERLAEGRQEDIAQYLEIPFGLGRRIGSLGQNVQLSADGDFEKGSVVLSSELALDPDQRHVAFSMDLDRSMLALWTAETPNLYTLVLTLLRHEEKGESNDNDNSAATHICQVESCRVGFRTIDIHDGALHCNGCPITVCGMNRHEHDPDHGKVVSLERMKQDVCLLK